MATEQGGASAWRADSNLCMHSAIEATVAAACSVAGAQYWTGGRLGSISPESKAVVFKCFLKM